jgi:spore maturation protein CgeB
VGAWLLMRFLIISRDYPEFLLWLYAQHRGLEKQPYSEQVRVRMESLFYSADFYARNLRKLGHEAWDVHFNNEPIQKAWAREYGLPVDDHAQLHRGFAELMQRARRVGDKTPLRYLRMAFLPLLRWLDSQQSWMYDILSAQTRWYKPDVILNQFIPLRSEFLAEHKPYGRLLVGQHASPVPPGRDFGMYDLMLSSLPSLVDHFRREGIPSELYLWCFEPTVLERLGEVNKSIDVSFVGTLFRIHGARQRWLDHVCRRTRVEVWAHGIDGLPRSSAVFDHYHGTAFGLYMYRILQSSRITLNHHLDVAQSYANNMRLFEATGVGTLLITDWKQNLHEMFELGKEAVAYQSPQECVDLIRYYLEHEHEREAIAQAGQKRTLRNHTYYQRMQELVDIVRKHL